MIRIAIVNRGEPAMRALHTLSEVNGINGTSFRTIALYTDPDRSAMFVRRADEAVYLGPALYLDKSDGRARHTYLDRQRLERALLEARVDAVWVGWGFVAEDADFAARCEALGITFIGPPVHAMRSLSSKIEAKKIAKRARVPVAPWSGGPVENVDQAVSHAERIGYPLLIKAAAGGGGRGIREVSDESSLAQMWSEVRQEAQQLFGDPTVFLERKVSGGRHVEVQVLGDADGTIWVLGVRECTVQRRRQKILEESSLAIPNPSVEARLRDYAVALCKMAGYENAGTVEFLYEPETDAIYFMEVNTRLQVEHTVTEMVTGLDLVHYQLRIAFGARLVGAPPASKGHAIEVRLNAEDPARDFAPAPGRIALYRPPNGPGIRVDSGVSQGDTIPTEFDSMIAKIIAWGPDRPSALRRLQRALEGTEIVIEGGATNKSFLLELVQRPEIKSGQIHTTWLSHILADGDRWPHHHAEIALMQAAVEAYEEELRAECEHFVATAVRGTLEVSDQTGRSVELRYAGNLYTVVVYKLGRDSYRLVQTDGGQVDVRVDRLGRYERTLVFSGQRYRALIINHGSEYMVEVQGVTHRVLRNEGGLVRSHFPAVVMSVLVNEGQDVAAGTPLFVLESMKMESVLAAPFTGRVRHVLVARGTQVDSGDVLARFEVQAGAEQIERGQRIHFGDPTADDNSAHDSDVFEVIDSLILGFDVGAEEADRAADNMEMLQKSVEDTRFELLLASEQDVIRSFCEIHALGPRYPVPVSPAGARPEDYFLAYLKSPERAKETLPAAFLSDLEAALSRYGVAKLDWSPETQDALLRISRSRRHTSRQNAMVVKILLRWRAKARTLESLVSDEFHELLDKLARVADAWSPTVADLARTVRSRFANEPMLDRARQKALSRLKVELDSLAIDADTSHNGEIARFVANPEPWPDWWVPWICRKGPCTWPIALEIFIRVHYRHLANLSVRAPYEGKPIIFATAAHGPTIFSIVAAVCDDVGHSFEVNSQLQRALRELTLGAELAVEIIRFMPGVVADEDSVNATVATLFDQFPPMRRVTVTTIGKTPERLVQYKTYERPAPGYPKVHQYRDFHPGVVERLELWRLENFAVTALHSSGTSYLFSGTAHENPKDRRLFAFAEVRDLSAVSDERRKVQSLPRLEQALRECLDLIRQHHSAYPARTRYAWNRVVLYIEPIWDLPLEALKQIADRVAPAARGLSLDMITLRMKIARSGGGWSDVVTYVSAPSGTGVQFGQKEPSTQPIRSLTDYRAKSAEMQRIGLTYPYDIVRLLTSPGATYSDFPSGKFQEYDLDQELRFVPVNRPYGENTANLVAGLITNFTAKHPDGMSRMLILNDPSKSLGSLGEAECRRILAAIDLAQQRHIPVEWFAVSSGARISMESGTENLDWTARVLRRLIQLTQAGHEVNVIVTGVNVGAQSYWNAEATMMMHTRGILVMVSDSAMVLTGKQALEYSGAVSADSNTGIGGYDRIMGINGEAQYWAPAVEVACKILFRHYALTYVFPGERFPRRAPRTDPVARDIQAQPHQPIEGVEFHRVGDVFDRNQNPDRKMPFDIRSVMRAVADADEMPLERWQHMRDADTAVVWDIHIGGIPVCMLGIESHEVQRSGVAPADGPRRWSAGTLYPKSSKKIARAINSASGNRPLIVLANLSGFDGSPESMRELQLEYGAEIGRAVVNFNGPFVFCVLSRYHGGAFVVFSKGLNDQIEALALEGSHASVLGGAPAAAVVFSREVERRVNADARIEDLRQIVAAQSEPAQEFLTSRLTEVLEQVRMEKRTEIAKAFDAIHTIDRALAVGSIDRIVTPAALRAELVGAVERGMQRSSAKRAD